MSRRSSQIPRVSKPGPSKKSQGKSLTQPNLTQTRIDEDFFDETTVKEKVNNLVRHFVFNSGHNSIFKRNDLQKLLKTKPREFQKVIEEATKIMKNVYGYNVLLCDQGDSSARSYLVSNALPHVDSVIPNSKGDSMKILLVLVLSHIFMTNEPTSDSSLYSFLKMLNITTERRHVVFGDVKDYIQRVLVQQKFLKVDTDPLSKKITFSWGIRAENEISKQEVLKFVCKIYGVKDSKSFSDQYKAAEEQGFDNKKLDDAGNMETD